MNKTTKGALAAAVAALLLLGGAGSLAYWYDEAIVPGTTVQAGELALADAPVCSEWVFDSGEDLAGKTYVVGDLLVPGDTLTMNCTVTITATGEHLRATFDAVSSTATGALAPYLDVTTSATIGGVVVPEIIEANNGQNVEVGVTVTFLEPGVEDNTSQTLSAALSDITVSLTQVHT